MADDPDRDIIPTKEVKHSYSASEVNSKYLSPEKRFSLHLSKTDLEDQIYKFKEENLQLKKASQKQEEDLKKLTTKMTRLLRKKKSMELMSSPSRKRDLELEEMVEDLQDKVRQLEKTNSLLREKALVAKQQVIVQNRRPNPYNHIPPKVNSGTIRSMGSPYVPSANLRGKALQELSKKSVSMPIPPYALSLLEEARNELSNLKMLVSSQKSEIEMYEHENDILKQKMRMREIEFEDELNALKSQLTQRQRQHVQENLDLIRLHRELKQKDSQILNIRAQYNDLEDKMRILKLNHDHLVKDMEDLALRFKNEQKKNVELLGELQKAEINSSTSSELQEKLKSLLKENDVLRETNDKLLHNTLNFEKERSFNQIEEILKGKIANLESSLAIQLNAKSIVEEELNKEREKLKSKDESYNQLKDYVDQMKSHTESLEAKINLLKLEEIDIDDIKNAITALKQQKVEKSTMCVTDLGQSEESLQEVLSKNFKNNASNKASNESRNTSPQEETSISLDTFERSEKFMSVITKEIEELKSKLSECEKERIEKYQEVDNLKEMLTTQQNINKITQEEVASLTKQLSQQEKEFQSKLEEYSHMLDIRATRINKLEKQLNDIAYGTKAFPVASANENENISPIKLSRGENIFEIHVKKINFTPNGLKKLYSPNSNIFLTWNFYEFEIQSTPVVSSHKSVFDFTAQYTVQVDDYFLYYLQDSAITLELHESLGVDFRTVASCQIKFSDILNESTKRIHGTGNLISVDESTKFEFGFIEYWVQLKIPMEEAFKYFKERIKALKYIHSNKELSTTAVQLLKQHKHKDSHVNELHIKILRAMNLKSKQKDIQPSTFCVYKFYEFPDQDTAIIPASNNPEYLYHHTFSLYIDPEFEKYLKTENFMIYVFDENDPDIASYIGRVILPLYPLVQNTPIKGTFPLQMEDDSENGAIELLIYWQYDYQPATSDTGALVPTSQQLIETKPEEESKSSSDAEAPNPDYFISKPPIPKPRIISAKQRTSTPISKNSGLSSPSISNASSNTSPNLSAIHQVDANKTTIPQPAERKSKLASGTSNPNLQASYSVKKRIQKIYDDELSDEMSDTKKKISFDETSEEEKQDFAYNYSEESENDSEVYADHMEKSPVTQVPSITILVSYLSLKKEAAVLQDDSVKLLYVEYRFLNYPFEELETPVSLPKQSYPKRITYNFKKVFKLESEDLEKWNLLSKMLNSESAESSLIKFTVVSEPPPDEQDLDCEDVGYGYVDLCEIVKENKDKIQEDILIYDARDTATVIGVLNISIKALEALSLLKTFSSLSQDS